jgi:(+)-trans-carveol dehydrogenase
MSDASGRGRLQGKAAFITGGARGQGRSHAVTMAREGADIVTIDICRPIPEVAPYETATEADLQETVAQVEALGRRCLAVKADARDGDAVQAVVERAIAELGHIDVLAVNHGVVVNRPWDETTDAMWDTVIACNLSAPWRVARAVIPHMVEQGGGSIVFTASTAAVKPYAALAAYSAAKAGLLGLMRALATELAPHWIRVNAVLPTNVSTPMMLNDGVVEMYTGRKDGTIKDMEFPAQAALLLPLPWVEPQDISNGVLFLASDEARYVTGIELPIDGGTLTQPPGIPPIAAQRLGELEWQAANRAVAVS